MRLVIDNTKTTKRSAKAKPAPKPAAKRALRPSGAKTVGPKAGRVAHSDATIADLRDVAAVKPGRSRKPAPRAAKPPKVRWGDRLWPMLTRPEGVSIAEIMEAFKILPHTSRAYISVETRKRGKKAVLRDGRYRVVGE